MLMCPGFTGEKCINEHIMSMKGRTPGTRRGRRLDLWTHPRAEALPPAVSVLWSGARTAAGALELWNVDSGAAARSRGRAHAASYSGGLHITQHGCSSGGGRGVTEGTLAEMGQRGTHLRTETGSEGVFDERKREIFTKGSYCYAEKESFILTSTKSKIYKYYDLKVAFYCDHLIMQRVKSIQGDKRWNIFLRYVKCRESAVLLVSVLNIPSICSRIWTVLIRHCRISGVSFKLYSEQYMSPLTELIDMLGL